LTGALVKELVLPPVQPPTELRHILTVGEDGQIVEARSAADCNFRLQLAAVLLHESPRVITRVARRHGPRAAREATQCSNGDRGKAILAQFRSLHDSIY
jgi:hypothetical protein